MMHAGFRPVSMSAKNPPAVAEPARRPRLGTADDHERRLAGFEAVPDELQGPVEELVVARVDDRLVEEPASRDRVDVGHRGLASAAAGHSRTPFCHTSHARSSICAGRGDGGHWR
jgi:hypothetical protein